MPQREMQNDANMNSLRRPVCYAEILGAPDPIHAAYDTQIAPC